MMAFDLGATSYRAMVGGFDGERLQVSEVLREKNVPIHRDGHYFWDVSGIFENLLGALRQSSQALRGIVSVGVDTWGTDFGLLGSDGRLLSDPIVYRDKMAKGMPDILEKHYSASALYGVTGCSVPEMSAVCMLLGMQANSFPALEKADSFLMMPDLIEYLFCGNKNSEYTILSSSRLIGASSRRWNDELIRRLGFPKHIFRNIVEPCTVVGELRPQLRRNEEKTKIIAVASHDTASAVSAIPPHKGQAFLSSGTWSVLGMVLDEPIISEQALLYGFENEGMPHNKIRFLKNIPGLWFLAQCLTAWKEAGEQVDLRLLDAQVSSVEPFVSMIYPHYSGFNDYGDMPRKIQNFCAKTGQRVPQTPVELLAAINQGLAMEYRKTIEELEELTGKPVEQLYIVGGGVQNKPLCQCAADICGIPVISGFQESVSVGNLLCQAQALGEIRGEAEMREVSQKSFAAATYEPSPIPLREEAYARYLGLRREQFEE